MNEKRGNLYLLTGLVIGLGLGLFYAWVVSPIQYIDTEPSAMAAVYKDAYRQVIALAYQANHNLGRARERLNLLDSKNSVASLAAQAQRILGEKQNSQEARALALLAADLSQPQAAETAAAGAQAAVQPIRTEEMIENTATLEASPFATLDNAQAIQTPTLPAPTITPTITISPTVTRSPVPTLTLRPSATPRPALSAPFQIKDQKQICDRSVQPGLLQVQVLDAKGAPLPGVRILITWQEGEEAFFTGLAPEINPGYADFLMTPGTGYNLKIGDASELVNNLNTDGSCSLWLEFSQEETR